MNWDAKDWYENVICAGIKNGLLQPQFRKYVQILEKHSQASENILKNCQSFSFDESTSAFNKAKKAINMRENDKHIAITSLREYIEVYNVLGIVT